MNIFEKFFKKEELKPIVPPKPFEEAIFDIENNKVVVISYDPDICVMYIDYEILNTLITTEIYCSYVTYLTHADRFKKKLSIDK